MTTTQQHLTTIAGFMGWEYDGTAFWPAGTIVTGHNPLSFDTMRMVLDKFKTLDIDPSNADNYTMHKKQVFDIIQTLGWGTPSDCAARLAEAIEWCKSVK